MLPMIRSSRAVHFNPRSPCGERHVYNQIMELLNKISIHAPRVGSDVVQFGEYIKNRISIHAPRVGSDADFRIAFACFF